MKLHYFKIIAIMFAFMLFNSDILATRFAIKKYRHLLAKKATNPNITYRPKQKPIKVKTAKARIDTAEFVINALASSGIPVIATVVSIFRWLFEAHRNMKTNSFNVKVKGLEGKSYPCTIQAVGMIYNDVKIKAQKNAVTILKQAKTELEVSNI